MTTNEQQVRLDCLAKAISVNPKSSYYPNAAGAYGGGGHHGPVETLPNMEKIMKDAATFLAFVDPPKVVAKAARRRS